MAPTQPTIEIQPIHSSLHIKALETLQQDIWGWSDLDTTPFMIFVAMKEAGGTLLGAFDGDRLVGFAFAIVGYDPGHTFMHSHLMGVHPDYLASGLGLRLKLAQRMAALERGFDRMTWTFDPLLSANAYLNFHKLGVVANRYKVNFYGEHNSSLLSRRVGTDRLWVEWFLTSNGVKARLESDRPIAGAEGDHGEPLIQVGRDGSAVRHAVDLHAGMPISIELPGNISFLMQEHPQLAVAWRGATRSAFIDAFAAGYTVHDFLRNDQHEDQIGCYLLTRGTVDGLECP
jgi:predicted GNAT superfamily acetyltransferase